MGLTIHYGLKFKGTTEEALAKLSLLRNRALDTPFQEVSVIKHFTNKYQSNWQNCSKDDEWRWTLIQAQGDSISIHPDGHRLKRGEHSEVGTYSISPMPIEAIIFRTWAGEGCEESNFGLCRYENIIEFHGKSYKLNNAGWRWSSFCKTQYASQKGLLNFIRCHTLVISMLDYAKEIGILKNVSDEGDYWQNRDLRKLAETIGEWNEFIAGFSAQLKTTFGGDKVESTIESHPHYEQLVKAGFKHLPPAMLNRLGKLTK